MATPTPIFICGAECGIAASGTASAGTEHWSGVSSSGVSVVTSGPTSMLSTRCFRHNGAGVGAFMHHTFATAIASPATTVARFYYYFASLPTASTQIFTDDANILSVWFVSSDSTIRAGGSGSQAASGVAVTTGRWYRIDVKMVAGGTQTVDVQVDGVAAAQFSIGGVAGSNPGFYIAGDILGVATVDAYSDNIVVSGTASDYPIGPGTCVGLYPSGDKTNSAATPTDGNGGHLFSATTDFGKGAGGATATGAQNAEATSWQSLQNPLSTTIPTNFIADLLGSSTEHLVWIHEAMPGASVVNGVTLVATTHSATATANNQSMKITDSTGGNALTAWSLLDLSEATITVPMATFATKPGGGVWDKAAVDACLIRWGDSSDVTPDAYLDGVCLEVDYVPARMMRVVVPPTAVHRASRW